MTETLKTHLNQIFVNYPKTPETQDLYDEVLANLTEHVIDYKAGGWTEAEAIEKSLAEIGDLTEVLDEISLTDLSVKFSSSVSAGRYSNLPLVNEKIFTTVDFEQISLNYQQDNIEILPSEDARIHLLEFMNSRREDYFAEIQSSTGELKIQCGKRPKLFGKLLPFRSKIVLLIPENYQKNLKLALTSGNLKISQLKLNNLEIDCYSGNFKAEQLKLGTVAVMLSSGNGNFAQIEAEKLNIKAKSGNLTLEQLEVYQADLEATSGNIRISIADVYKLFSNVKSGNLKIQGLKTNTAELSATSGNLTVYSQLFSQLKVISGSGNAKVVTSDELDFQFELHSSHGNTRFSLPSAHYTTQTQTHKSGYNRKESKHLLYLETGSGNASVKAEEEQADH